MRTRAWRRHMEECVVKRRLMNIQSRGWWCYFKNINGIKIGDPRWVDFIGTSTQHMYKTHTTKWNDTGHKTKYSPNSGRTYWRDRGKKGNREKDKAEFKKMLDREYGIKHYYTEQYRY